MSLKCSQLYCYNTWIWAINSSIHIDQFKLCCKFIIPECSNHKSTMYMFKGNIIILIHTL